MIWPRPTSLYRRGSRSFARGIVFCLSLLMLSGAIASADAPLDDYNLAVQLYRQNRWAIAADSFRKFLEDYPEHEKRHYARLYLGLTQVNQSDFKAARENLRQFVKDSPNNQNLPQARYRIGECSYLLNDLPAARTELAAYLKAHAEDAFADRALPYLGDVQLRLNDPESAAATFQKAMEQFPEGPLIDDARYGRAKALDALKRPAEAFPLYQQVAKGASSRAAEAQFQVGSHLFDTGKFPEAAAAYRQVWDRFPEASLTMDARLNAGFALYRAGNFLEAATVFEPVTADATRGVTAGYWRGMSLKSGGNHAAAAAALAKVVPSADKHPLEQSLIFQQGVCARLAGDNEAAEAAFLSVVKKFPTGDFADDALHFATELAIDAGQLDVAIARRKQFAENFPQSGLRLYQELLGGRLSLGKAAQLITAGKPANEIAAEYDQAARSFERVLAESMLARTKLQARYYLALARQLQGDHRATLELLKPLIAEIPTEGAHELGDALVLQADSFSQTEQWDAALAAAKRYRQQFPQGRQRFRALAITAIAQARLNQLDASNVAWNELLEKSDSASLVASTTLQLAELAEQRQDWKTAESLYNWLTKLAKGTENEAFARRGLAWALFQQKQFPAAAQSFAMVESEFPQHRLAPECAYYHAEAVREAGQLPQAAAAFAAAFAKYAPAESAPPGAELQAPGLFAYRAGLQAARVYRQLKQVDPADKGYAAVLEKFPKPQHLDKLLDEWALLNYEANRFEQADVLFARLLRETPESDLADNAKLSLAESDLLADRLDKARAAFDELRQSPTADATVKERAHYQSMILAMDQQRWNDVLMLTAEFEKAFATSALRPYVAYCNLEAQLADLQATSEVLAAAEKQLREQIDAPAPVEIPAWYPRLWILLAEVRFRKKDYAGVEQAVTELKQRLPNGPLLYQAEEVLGRCFKQQAEFDKARAAFQRAIADPTSFRTETAAKSQFLLAETYFLQEKWLDAFRAYMKVYSNYAAYPSWQAAALLQAGKCDEQQGEWKTAAQTYEQLITEFPQSTHIAEAKKRQENARKRVSN